MVEYRPINELSDNSPVEICVPQTGSKHIDLRRPRLYVKACIKKGNFQDLDEKDYVDPCNLFLQTLFLQVDAHLQQKLVSSGTAVHVYGAMFDKLLNLTTILQRYRRGSASEDDTEINQGFVSWQKLTGVGQSADMEGSVYAESMQTDRYLLNGCELRMKFH